VPYIHCPECRVTIYGGTAYNAQKRCPRCDAEMKASPRPLFHSFGVRSKKSRGPDKAPPGPVTGGEQLNAG